MSFNEEQRPTPLVKRQPRDRKLIMLPGLTALLHGTLDPERVVGANEKGENPRSVTTWTTTWRNCRKQQKRLIFIRF